MTDEKEVGTTDASATDTSDNKPRRVRRTRQIEAEAPATEAAGDAATPAPAAARPAPNVAARPAPEATPRPPREARVPGSDRRHGQQRSGGYGRGRFDGRRRDPALGPDRPRPAVGKLAKKTIYRQDVVGVPLPSEPAKPEPKTASDKLTLLLHPAPKSAPWKKKKEDKPLTAKEALKAKLAKQGAPKKEGTKGALAAELQAAWLSADAAGALEAARSAGDGGEALVQAWLEHGNVAAIAQLASLDAAPGRARKAARRALNVLKARGVTIPEPVATAAKVVASAGPAECTASYIPPDGSGMAFFSLSQRLADGRFRVADVMVRDEVGIVHASSGVLAGKHIRRWKTRVEESFGSPPIEVPLDWARHAIAEGRKKNAETKHVVPLGYDGCLTLAAPAPVAAPAHPLASLETTEISSFEIEQAVLDSDRLHVELEFRSWSADRAPLEELLAKVGERLSGTELEDRAAVDSALTAEVRAATDRFFTPERRATVASRMRDAAISIRARKRDEVARRTLALALAIRQAGLVTQPPQEIPFLLAFFQKGVAMMAQQAQGRLSIPARQASV
jgi:hypothetical protein